MDDFIIILLVVITFIGIPLLVLYLRDKSSFGCILMRIVGAVSILIGLSLIGAGIYMTIDEKTPFLKIPIVTILGFILPITLILFGWRWLKDEGPGIDDITIPENDTLILTSVVEAQKTLHYFIHQIDEHIDGACCLIEISIKNNLQKIPVWSYVHRYDNDYFDVSITEDAADKYHITKTRFRRHTTEVKDWMIILEDGGIKGAFSYIAKFNYLLQKGYRLNQTLRKQKEQLIDYNRY